MSEVIRSWIKILEFLRTLQHIGVARGCTGCTCTFRAEKKLGSNLQGKL